MTTETRKRQNYTEDFKQDAVALVTEQGYKVSEAARSLGVGDNLIRRWRREFKTRRMAKSRIFEYIETHYNRQRKHSAIGHWTPMLFEQAA